MTDKHPAARLFEGWEKAMIFSCLQGYMGAVHMDDEENPASAMAEAGDICFFAGEPSAALFRTLAPYKLLVPGHAGWESLIEGHFGGKVRKFYRYALKKEPDAFDTAKLAAFADALPGGFELRLFDRELYDMALGEAWSADLCSQFKSFDEYQRLAVGVGIVYEGALVAGASPYAVYDGGIEIEIDTRPDFRQKGLATICGAKLILECLSRGVYPSWDAHDARSLALAQKLGYRLSHPYVTYELSEQEKTTC